MALAFLLAAGACSGQGCGGCAMEPLPGGGLPADQTVEGGAQIRVTEAGFDKLTSLVPAALNDAFAGGFCIPENQVVNAGVAEAAVCGQNTGSCAPGCQVNVTLDDVVLTPSAQALNVHVVFDAHADVPIDYEVFWLFSGTCDADFDLQNGTLDADLTFGIDPATGELEIQLEDVHEVDLTGITVSGDCGAVDDIVDAALGLFASLLDSFLGDFVVDAAEPLLDDLVQGLLPEPLGLAGVADLSGLLGQVSPGTDASLELRVVPGGFVELVSGGLTLGVITGVNADEDPSTRDPGLSSEPALCVPHWPAPDFAAAPASLSQSPRGTFQLFAADAFRGSPEPDKDLVLGASETFLDLSGHHAVSSGSFCMTLGTELVPQLNLGALGIVVPSLAELGSEEGGDPLLLATRPTRPADFTIGDGTEASPSLTLHVDDFEIDFYAYLFERYVRGFTVSLDLAVGVNLEFTVDDAGAPAVLPILVGLEAENIGVEVLNSEFLRESAEDLEDVFPALLDLVLPLVVDRLGAITLPEFAGFRLEDLSVEKVTTAEDDFLALGARLGASPAMMALGDRYPSLAAEVASFAAEPAPPRAVAHAELVRVSTPRPADLRAALAGRGGALPEVVVDAATHDELGRELEWTWRLGGGMWRPFRPGGELVLRERAFAIQGRYDLELRARVAGDYRTLAPEPIVHPVIFDSVGPRIHVERASRDEGALRIPASDLVSPPERIELAFGAAGDARPATGWSRAPIAAADARALAGADGALRIFARDEAGNESEALLDLGLTASARGCNAAGPTGTGTALLLGLALLALARPRRLAALLPLALVAACGSDPDAAPTCELDDDCAASCEAGQIPTCDEGACRCLDDIPVGRLGMHSSMAMAEDGTMWVAGYNLSHGDLMVASRRDAGPVPADAWAFVAGVPDGPVVVPGSTVRGGIRAAGADVGLYTDTAVTADGAPLVSYFDADTGSLSLAARRGDAWSTHVVDPGRRGDDPELGERSAGHYSSLAVTSDGRPVIAYYASEELGGEVRSELRYAEATRSDPASADDWTIAVLHEAVVPAEEVEADPLVLPDGTGLFVDLALRSDDTPVVVYYDRTEGALAMASASPESDTGFAIEILDGGDRDVGWYPSVAIDDADVAHVAYVDFSNHDLLYLDSETRSPELVDDGYRYVGTTSDGLPVPEFHFVGDDASLVLTTVGPVIAYQDATSHELLVATRAPNGAWQHATVAGDEDPFEGGYGFYADASGRGSELAISSWVVDQGAYEVWVELFRRQLAIE